jgi:hypothetical protein
LWPGLQFDVVAETSRRPARRQTAACDLDPPIRLVPPVLFLGNGRIDVLEVEHSSTANFLSVGTASCGQNEPGRTSASTPSRVKTSAAYRFRQRLHAEFSDRHRVSRQPLSADV